MKIKDAMQVLEAFKAIAGDDAEINVDHFALRSALLVEYYSAMGGSYYDSDRKEKSRTISYTVDVVLPITDQQPVQVDPTWFKQHT